MNTPRFEIFTGKTGTFWWRFRAANGQIVAGSTEGYCSLASARRAVYRTRELFCRHRIILEL